MTKVEEFNKSMQKSEGRVYDKQSDDYQADIPEFKYTYLLISSEKMKQGR